jgi:hypothetical protein
LNKKTIQAVLNISGKTGHDYSGRSTGAGALSIWTHFLDSTEAVPEFIPDGCNTNSSYVVKAGPGVDVEALYKWGGENGRVTIGGTTTTVGATGGYILGGGLGTIHNSHADREKN